ncbi:hypothetical protein [Liberiplasma polymorphum]|uniref:hypothetical protein n=1 Tax=Liberiplasma polymorphum TaxID=3374570 RepID=UPI0037743889
MDIELNESTISLIKEGYFNKPNPSIIDTLFENKIFNLNKDGIFEKLNEEQVKKVLLMMVENQSKYLTDLNPILIAKHYYMGTFSSISDNLLREVLGESVYRLLIQYCTLLNDGTFNIANHPYYEELLNDSQVKEFFINPDEKFLESFIGADQIIHDNGKDYFSIITKGLDIETTIRFNDKFNTVQYNKFINNKSKICAIDFYEEFKNGNYKLLSDYILKCEISNANQIVTCGVHYQSLSNTQKIEFREKLSESYSANGEYRLDRMLYRRDQWGIYEEDLIFFLIENDISPATIIEKRTDAYGDDVSVEVVDKRYESIVSEALLKVK